MSCRVRSAPDGAAGTVVTDEGIATLLGPPDRPGAHNRHATHPLLRANCSLPPLFWVTPVALSTWRRMSRIGSTERTRGISSKLLTGGGDVVNHSSVLPFHGSGPAIRPTTRLRATLTIVRTTPEPRMNDPIVEIKL